MAVSMWQQLFDALKVRLQSIRVANGYQTDIGENVMAWRDLSKNPFTQQESPCCTVRDTQRSREVDADTIQAHYFQLSVEIVACAAAAFSSPPDNLARAIIADIDRALGLEAAGGRRFTVNGVNLALDTLLGEDTIEAVHSGDRFVVIRKTFTIRFRTGLFRPDSQ